MSSTRDFFSRMHTNYYESATKVKETMDPERPFIAGKVAFNDTYTEFTTVYNSIMPLGVKRKEYEEGMSRLKNETRDKTEDSVFKLAGLLYNYGDDNGKPEIVAAATVTKGYLNELSFEGVYAKGMQLHDICVANMADLVDFEITPESDSEFLGQLDLYKDVIGKTSGSMSKGHSLTQQINEAFKKMNKLLRKLDRYMEKVKDEKNEFYLAYKQARKIYDLGGSHKQDTPPPVDPAPVNPPQ